jgi:hypothetical protein
MADDLPAVAFGPNRIRTFTSSELAQAVDLPRLERMNPHRRFDAMVLSQFIWLVVEEAYALDREPGQRTKMIDFKTPPRTVPAGRRGGAICNPASAVGGLGPST